MNTGIGTKVIVKLFMSYSTGINVNINKMFCSSLVFPCSVTSLFKNCLLLHQGDHKNFGTKIYTKTGDQGSSSLFTGERRLKSDIVFDILGDVDELNSNIGMCRELLKDSWQQDNFEIIGEMLGKVQCSLLDIGSCVATPLSSSTEKLQERTKFDPDLVVELEQWIDKYTKDLPELKNFILPSGGKSSCSLHICRSICRRTERKASILRIEKNIDSAVSSYLNRLSDFLFTLARYAATMEGQTETIYKKPKKNVKIETSDNSSDMT